MNKRDIKAVKTLDDLEGLGIGKAVVDVGGRGGGVGFRGADVARALDVSEGDLPRSFGAGCNYLGGGVRGSIFPSTYSDRITGRAAELLDLLAAACVRVYEWIESEDGLQDDTDEDGEPNWENKATKAARAHGTVSAY